MIMSKPVKKQVQRYTYADLLKWPEGERWELIDGVAYDMSPAPMRVHQEIVSNLLIELGTFLRDHPCQVYPAPFDVRLPETGEDPMHASTVVQPDITVVCDPEKLDERGCVGAPTLVVEVLSPSTATKDLREKLNLYERAGVPEYWVISPNENWVMVFTPTEEGKYGPATVYGKEDSAPVGVLPGLEIELSLVFPK